MVARHSCQCHASDVVFAGLGLGPVLFVLVVGSGLLSAWIGFGDHVLVEDFEPLPQGSNVTTILYYTMWFENVVAPLTGYQLKTCPGQGGASLECAFTSNKHALGQAHVVVFHSRDLELAKMPAARPFASQLWAYWSEENPLYDHRSCGWYYRFKWWERQCDKVSLNPERLALFDLRMGYQLSSDVVVSYIHPSLKQHTDRPMSPSWQDRRNAVVWIANNCASFNKREKYIAALMKHYPVHSYGDCLRTMPGKEGKVSEEEILKLMSQYKFAFAWENANCADYVTEKLEHAFISGALPIVDGPDDYSPFVPNNHSVIHVSDFAGPKALADHLRRLEKDRALYESYFTYKPPKSHYDPAFLAADLGQDIGCKLCRTVAQRRAEARVGGEQHVGRKKVVQLDGSCTRRRWDREYYDDGTMSSGPAELLIEEWGFGSEDLVLWAIGVGGVLASLLLARLLRRKHTPKSTL